MTTSSDVQAFPETTVNLHQVLQTLKQDLRNEMAIARNSATVVEGGIKLRLVTNTHAVRRKVFAMFAPHKVTNIIFDNPDLPPEPGVVPTPTSDTAEMSTVGTAEMNTVNPDQKDAG